MGESIKLRYDLAADAILNLQHYLDSSAEDENISYLLEQVQESLDKLVLIEAKNRQKRRAGELIDTDMVSAMNEITGRMDAVREKVQPVMDFVRDYANEICALQAAFHGFAGVKTLASSMKGLERQLEKVRETVTIC